MTTDQAASEQGAILSQAGSALRARRPDLALSVLQPLLQQAKKNPDGLKLAGMALSMMGRDQEAAVLLRERLQQNSESPEWQSDLANVLLNLGQAEQALDVLESSSGQQKLPESYRFNRGRALKAAGRPAEAVPEFEKVLQQRPDHSAALISLADSYKALGELEKASARIREVISMQPDNALAWWSLANQKRSTFSDSEFRQLKQSAAQPRPPDQQLYFEFALATAHEQRKEYAAAFERYQKGNQLKRTQRRWNRTEFRDWLKQLRGAFDTTEFPRRPDTLDVPRPVFIVSLPRSGSTLTEQMLAAHPQVTAASELPWIPRLMAEASEQKSSGIQQWASALSAQQWQELGRRYLEKTIDWHQRKHVFTDKLPGNFPYTPAILHMFPSALIVSVSRDAHDVCWSCYRQLFISGSEFSYDLEDLAAYWVDFQREMQHWQRKAPNRVLNLQYESLVADPESECRRLLEFLDLPWDDKCLDFHQARRAVNTASAAQVREKINKRGLQHWKKFESELTPLTEALARQKTSLQDL